MVPSANVGESNLHAEICLDELRGLPKRVSETAARIVRARRRSIALGIGGLQHLYRFERLRPVPCSTLSTDCAYMASKVLPSGAAGGVSAGNAKSTYVADGNGRCFAGKNSRQGSAEGDGAKRTGGGRLRLHCAIEPAIAGDLHTGSARFHVVLRVEV